MDACTYLEKMNAIQNILLEYIDDEEKDQTKFRRLLELFQSQKIQEDKHLLTSILHLLATIANYHYRTHDFYDKVFKLIQYLKDSITKYYSNHEIYNFFRVNKRVILFLLEEKMMIMDDYIASQIRKKRKERYFFPEIKQFISENEMEYINVPDNLQELRKKEYAEEYIVQLVQNDSLDEFISYLNKSKSNINKAIERSIFETNPILSLHSSVTLIQYSAFFGSIRIFKYLMLQNCRLEQNLWKFAIHGRNPEIIHILEDKNIKLNDHSYKKCLELSIKCHHNELVNYFLNKCIEKEQNLSILKSSLKFYNFEFIQQEMINSNCLYDLCKTDYFYLVKAILENDKNIDINSRITKESFKYSNEGIKSEKTILHGAIKKGNYEIVQLLVENKDIDINKKSLTPKFNIEVTPLYEAIQNGNVKCVQCLLDHKNIDVNLKSSQGREQLTPLYSAVINNYIDIVRILINRNDISINLKSIQYEEDCDECTLEYYREITPLYLAVQYDRYDIVKLLLENKEIDVNNIANIKIDQYRTFTKERFEPSYNEETALYKAIIDEKIEIVKLLLSHEKIDININSKYINLIGNEIKSTNLQTAVQNGNIEIVKLLLEHKNVNINEVILDMNYCKPGIDIWDKERTESSKLELRKSLKRGSSSCIFQDIIERTALHIAIDNEDVEIVRLLLEYENIDVNIRTLAKSYYYYYDREGNEQEKKLFKKMTPLYFAVEKGNIQIIQLLVNHKNLDINKKSIYYLWFYKGIFLKGEQDKEKCQIEEIDKEETAIHNAISKGNESIIILLLSNKNINLNVTNKQGKRPTE